VEYYPKNAERMVTEIYEHVGKAREAIELRKKLEKKKE